MRQDWREFEPEERSKAGMQALSPAHSPYSTTNARNQIRNKAALESRGSGAASLLDHTVLLSPAVVSTILSVDKSSKRDTTYLRTVPPPDFSQSPLQLKISLPRTILLIVRGRLIFSCKGDCEKSGGDTVRR